MADTTYDRVPYRAKVVYDAHPARLGALAVLFGLEPPAPERCRYLEVGCANGANLLPLAETFPEARFVGVDASRVQVEQGRETIAALGLGNVELRCGLLEELTDEGPYDYVVAHGVFSWVPAPARLALLRLVRRVLSPHGVALISYNAYPGWHLRRLLRESMLYHAAPFEDPDTRVRQARAMLDFLVRSVPDDAWGRALREEAQGVLKLPDWFIFHDLLSDENRPFYLQEFVDLLDDHGLQYLGEPELRLMMPSSFPPETAAVLSRVGDFVRTEQYMDLVRNRTFRRSHVVRAEAPIDRGIGWERMTRLSFATRAVPVGREGDEVLFRAPRGQEFSTDKPLVEAAILELSETRPAPMPFGELLERARARLGRAAEGDAGTLGSSLIDLVVHEAVDTWSSPPPVATAPGPRPRVGRVASWLAARGVREVPNRRHESIEMKEEERILVALLDGTRTRLGVVAGIMEAALRGELDLGAPTDDPDALAPVAAAWVDDHLERATRTGLLAP